MPLYDTTTVVSGYNQEILDWPLGDDRQFLGDVQLSVNPPPPGDLNLSDAYFTLKLNPTDPDSDAILQLHITQTPTSSGYIYTALSGAYSGVAFLVTSGTYQDFVSSGTVYYWDFRCITATGGRTFTVATGVVQYLQNVTQTDKAGTPANYPFQGQPRFRGFTSASPNTGNTNTGWSNTGDIWFNSNPFNGNGIGWQCLVEGNPGFWLTLVNGGSSINDPYFQGYASEPPSSGTWVALDYFLNSSPAANQPEGWVCVTGGTPGTWKTKGIIGS
jgi:hypothetical protein